MKMNKKISLFHLIERLGMQSWRSILESARRIVGLFHKAQLRVFGKLTKEDCIAVYLLSKDIVRLYRKSSGMFTAQY